MDYEYFLRCLYYLLKIIAISPEALEALRNWWNSFKEFLPSLQYPDVQEESSSPEPTILKLRGTLYMSTFPVCRGTLSGHATGSAGCSATLS